MRLKRNFWRGIFRDIRVINFNRIINQINQIIKIVKIVISLRKTFLERQPTPKVPTEAFMLEISYRLEQKIADKWQLDAPEQGHFWQWVINNPQLPLLITGGAKKAGCLLSCGYPAIALPDINNTYGADKKTLIPHILAFAGRWREICFVFDQDEKWTTRQAVNKAISKIGASLTDLQTKVSVAVWDSDKGKGIDDAIAKHGADFLEEVFYSRITLDTFESQRTKKTPRYDLNKLLDFFSLEFKHRLAYDNLKDIILLDGKAFQQNNYRAWLVSEYGIDASKENLLEAITYQAQKYSFNPIELYLKKVIVCKERVSIDDLSTRYLGTTEAIYNVFIKKWLIGAVARVLEPGCKMDVALILQGKEGIGKSSFFAVLGGQGFDDSMTDLGSKDNLLIMHRCWIQELSKFDKLFSKRAAAKIKAFLTRSTDIFRKPYAEKAEEHPRRSVFCGSVNDTSFLLDEAGKRRFWVIPVPSKIKAIDLEQLAKEKDGIWATAIEAYRSHQQWWLTPEEAEQLLFNNEQFEVADTWESEIADYLEIKDEISIKKILQEQFGLPPVEQDKRTQMRVARILSKLGWVKAGRKRIEGKKVFLWKSPLKSNENRDSKFPNNWVDSYVLYDSQLYKVMGVSGSHLNLEGKDKAVPIWQCKRQS